VCFAFLFLINTKPKERKRKPCLRKPKIIL